MECIISLKSNFFPFESKLTFFNSVQAEEQILDQNYQPNAVFTRANWHSADDILAEIEGL